MKFFNCVKTSVASLLIIVAMTSCTNDTNSLDQEQNEYLEVAKSSEIDRASESMDDIAIQIVETQQNNEQSRTPGNFNLPDCVSISVVIEQNYREITVDFGTEGCLINGNLYRGIMTLTYSRNPEIQEITITKTLTDFYFNALSIVGTKTILKELSNENGNPQFTKTVNITVVWPDGSTATRSGTKIREWIEGFNSGVWSDNVFEITGNWTTTFVNGNTHSYTVITPLRRETVCFYFVSGSIDVVRTNFSGVFDYGNGDCDNLATFTFANDTVVDVILN